MKDGIKSTSFNILNITQHHCLWLAFSEFATCAREVRTGNYSSYLFFFFVILDILFIL